MPTGMDNPCSSFDGSRLMRIDHRPHPLRLGSQVAVVRSIPRTGCHQFASIKCKRTNSRDNDTCSGGDFVHKRRVKAVANQNGDLVHLAGHILQYDVQFCAVSPADCQAQTALPTSSGKVVCGATACGPGSTPKHDVEFTFSQGSIFSFSCI